jgi:hypothetical protein
MTINPGSAEGWPKRIDDESMKGLMYALASKRFSMADGRPAIALWHPNGPEYGRAVYTEGREYRLDENWARFDMGDRDEVNITGTVHIVWLFRTWEPGVGDYSHLADRLHDLIPGANSYVRQPCTCPIVSSNVLWSLVQHLNDSHHPDGVPLGGDKWSRERIADWLEGLDLDLSVDPERAQRRSHRRGPTVYTEEQVAAMQETMKKFSQATLLTTESVKKMIGLFNEDPQEET